jgi:hypothetical protein
MELTYLFKPSEFCFLFCGHKYIIGNADTETAISQKI